MGNMRDFDHETAVKLRASMADVQAGLIESIAGLEKMMASLAAHRAVLVDQAHEWSKATVDQVVPAGAAPQRRTELAERSFVAEMACALRVPERSAQKLIAESAMLVSDLPQSLTSLAEGRIGYRHAQVLVDECYGVDADDRAKLEAAVIDRAGDSTPSRLRARVRRVRESMHPETMGARAKAAVDGRSFTAEHDRDGMGWLHLYAQSPLVAGIDDRVEQVAVAMKKEGDPRTLAQLRADIAAMLLLGNATGNCSAADGADDRAAADPRAAVDDSADPRAAVKDNAADYLAVGPDRHNAMKPLARLLEMVRPELNVAVPALTLLGKSELPATLDGVTPIDADTARLLASVAPSFTRLLTHPETGVVLSVGRKKYRPPPDLLRYLRLRDGTCRFPGCRRRARRTEIDHTRQRQSGGPTQSDNLACLCSKHHHLKDETVWKVVQLSGGVLEWTSPAGRTYTTYPELELPTAKLPAVEPTTAEPTTAEPTTAESTTAEPPVTEPTGDADESDTGDEPAPF